MTELAIMLAATSAAGLQGRKVLRLRQRPRLRIRLPDERTPDRVRLDGRPALVWGVRLENRGSERAVGCQALLERFERHDGALWQRHPGFPVPIPLPWSGTGARPSLDLEPGGRSEELPLVGAWLDEPKLRLLTPLQISSGILLDYPPGRYRLTVSVQGSGRAPIERRRFAVRFDGRADSVLLEDVGP